MGEQNKKIAGDSERGVLLQKLKEQVQKLNEENQELKKELRKRGEEERGRSK